MADPKTVIEVAGREVAVSHPHKVYFPETGHTKLDLVRYYLSVADGALRGVAGRPMALKRFVNGIAEEPFYQRGGGGGWAGGAGPADGAEAVRERDRGRAVLPEAGAGQAPGVGPYGR